MYYDHIPWVLIHDQNQGVLIIVSTADHIDWRWNCFFKKQINGVFKKKYIIAFDE
jgi:hypothetical protein